MKQETLEEVAEKYKSQFIGLQESRHASEDFINGAKWQQERMYNEEEVLDIIYCFHYDLVNSNIETKDKWFEQFKKKQNERNRIIDSSMEETSI